MTPELQILIINATCLAVGYLGIYPSLVPRGLVALALADLGVCAVAIGTAGLLFWGSGTGFSLIVAEVNWFVFSLLTLIAMEAALFPRFARRHGIWPGDGP
ncbi:MAG: hypothetical protein JJT95_12375 [Pararhodobacter sp.]|nr:hypothetical protein [Pararhodobacter sp.]